jgi:hypothetical protein
MWGCGAAPAYPPAGLQVGLHISLKSLLEAQRLYPNAYFVCRDGERLPFRDGAFDAVISRVALPLGFAWWDSMRRARSIRPRAMVGGVVGYRKRLHLSLVRAYAVEYLISLYASIATRLSPSLSQVACYH